MASFEQTSLNNHVQRHRKGLLERYKHGWVILLGDIIALLLGGALTIFVYFQFHLPVKFIEFRGQTVPVYEIFSYGRTWAAATVLLAFLIQGQYTERCHYYFQLKVVFLGGFFGIGLEGLYRSILGEPASFSTMFVAWTVLTFSMLVMRLVTSNLLLNLKGFRQRTIVFFDSKLADHARTAIKRKPRHGYKLAEDGLIGMACSGSTADWKDFQKVFDSVHEASQRDDLFVFPVETIAAEFLQELMAYASLRKRPIALVVPSSGFRLKGFRESWFFGEDLCFLYPIRNIFGPTNAVLKRVFDILFSAASLLVAAPMFLLFSFAIKMDGGSAFYVQKRIGRNGTVFNCLKFRSMVENGDDVLDQYLAANPAAKTEWDRDQKLKSDPRVTKVGKVLRKTSLDELPQLINVLKGEMSIVGPRPMFVEQDVLYGDAFADYCSVRPGITGLWQVSGRNHTTFEERVEIDRWYVQNYSIWLDIFIILKTIPEVLFTRGAY